VQVMKSGTKLQKALCPFLFMFLGSCRSNPIDLSKAEMSYKHSPIIIDGRKSSAEEWIGSISVPFHKDGSAEFLWNGAGVYVYLSADWAQWHYSNELLLLLSSNPEKWLPVGFLIKLEMPYPVLTDIVRICARSSQDWESFEELLPPFDERAVIFAAKDLSSCSHVPTKWVAELFVAWEILDCESAPYRTLRARIW
jgi:hypothetical protein